MRCEDCVAMSWFILVLMLCISLVVAVPVSQLRAVLGKVISFFYIMCWFAVGWSSED